jgi:serine/threonine-protein kinase
MYALKYRTGGEKWSRPFKTYVYPYSPAIVDGALYVVGISGHKDRTGFLYALDAGTGVTNWQVQATVTAPPTVAHGRVYYPEKTRIVARATDGTLVWSRDLNDECPYTRVASAVAAGAESLFVGMVCYKSKGQPIGDGILYALDQSGRVQWLYRTDGEIRNGVVLRDGTVYLVTHSGAVHAVDRSTGKRVWQIEVDNQIRTAPVVSPDTIYVGAYSGAVYALTATTGDIKWTTVTEIGATGLSATEDIVVVGGDSVTALYSNDGSVVWSFSSGNYSSTFGPPVIGRQAVCCGACIKNDPQDKYQNAVFAMMER